MKLKFLLEDEVEELETTEEPMEEEIVDDTVEPELTDDSSNEDITPEEPLFSEEKDSEVDFISSNELNELREILLDIPDDISLLLLNDDVIVLATEDENNINMIYTYDDEDDSLELIEMPMELDSIMSNGSIIKYSKDSVFPHHTELIDKFMHKLEDEKEDIPNE